LFVRSARASFGFALLLLFISVGTVRADEAHGADAAIETYKTEMRQAARELLDVMDEPLNKASEAGDRERVRELLTARHAFRFDGEEPTLSSLFNARGQYRRAAREAQQKLDRSLQRVTRKLIQQGKRKEIAALRKQKRGLINQEGTEFIVPPLLRQYGGEQGEQVAKVESGGMLYDFSADGRHLVYAQRNRSRALIYDTVEEKLTKLTHNQQVWNAQMSPGNQWVVTLCTGGDVYMWDWRNQELLAEVEGPSGWESLSWPQIAVAGYGRSALAASGNELWWVDLRTGETLWRKDGFDNVRWLRIRPDGFAAMAMDKNTSTLHTFDLPARQEKRR